MTPPSRAAPVPVRSRRPRPWRSVCRCWPPAPTTRPPTGGASADPRALTVTATDTTCEVSAATAPSGNLRFSVTNTGSKVNEFYLLAEDGLRIVGEVENIGPGLTRDLVLQAAPGTYFTACKPGMVGDGIRAEFTVSDSGETLAPNEDEKALVEQANTLYAAYVRDQTDQLLAKTQEFTTALHRR